MRKYNYYTLENPLYFPMLLLAGFLGILLVQLHGFDMIDIDMYYLATVISVCTISLILICSILLTLNQWYNYIMDNNEISNFDKATIALKTGIIFIIVGFILSAIYSGMFAIMFLTLPCILIFLMFYEPCTICNAWLKNPVKFKDKLYCNECLDDYKKDMVLWIEDEMTPRTYQSIMNDKNDEKF